MSFGIPVRNGLGIGLLPSTAVSTLRIGGRPALILNFIGATSLDSRVTFTRGTTATFTGSNGLIQTAAIDAPRFDYNPTTLAPKGLLIEEARTNLTLYSQDFTNALWVSLTGGTGVARVATANAGVSPDGTNNATRLQLDCTDASNSANRSGVRQPIVILNTTAYASSVYVKAYDAGNVGKTLRIVMEGVAVAPTVTLTSSWQRVVFTGTSSSVSGAFVIECRGGSTTQTADFLVYGAQVEAGAFATSYIPTTTLAVARNADVATMTGTNFSDWYNASQGTFVAQFTPSTISGTKAVLDANDNTANESIRLQTVSADPFFTVTDGGVSQANIDAGTVAANTAYKMAGAYALNDFAASFAGGSVGTDTSGTLPTVNQLQIGNSAAGNRLNGCVGSIAYYSTRLSNATLQVLTT